MTLRQFHGLQAKLYEHPFDSRALTSLQKTPGLSLLFKKINEYGIDRLFRFRCTANALRISPRNFPVIYSALETACNVLDVQPIPGLYLMHGEGYIRTLTVGVQEPMVIVNVDALERLNEAEWLFVLGHELGHIKSQHLLYHQTATILPVLGRMIATSTLGLGGIATNGIELALYQWMMMAKLTCDRAGLLACQDPTVATRTLIKLAGLPELYLSQAVIDEFLDQAREFGGYDLDNLDKLTKILSFTENMRPWTILRAAELLKWLEVGNYHAIAAGTYLFLAGDVDPASGDEGDWGEWDELVEGAPGEGVGGLGGAVEGFSGDRPDIARPGADRPSVDPWGEGLPGEDLGWIAPADRRNPVPLQPLNLGGYPGTRSPRGQGNPEGWPGDPSVGNAAPGNPENLPRGDRGNLSPGNLPSGNLSSGNRENLPRGNPNNLPPGNLSPGNRENLPSGNRDNFSRGDRGNFAPRNPENLPRGNREDLPPGNRDNFPRGDREDLPPRNLPPRNRENLSRDDRGNFGPRNPENLPRGNREDLPPGNRDNFSRGDREDLPSRNLPPRNLPSRNRENLSRDDRPLDDFPRGDRGNFGPRNPENLPRGNREDLPPVNLPPRNLPPRNRENLSRDDRPLDDFSRGDRGGFAPGNRENLPRGDRAGGDFFQGDRANFAPGNREDLPRGNRDPDDRPPGDRPASPPPWPPAGSTGQRTTTLEPRTLAPDALRSPPPRTPTPPRP